MSKLSPSQYLILGSSGFLGSHFARRLGAEAISHISTDREGGQNPLSFRFSNSDDLRTFIRAINCKTIINCIAIADIELCESERELAQWVNTDIPRILGEICESTGKKLIHVSTDAVFDGKKPFVSESDIPTPLSNYGKTKLAGEHFVIKNSLHAQVFRVNFFGVSQDGRSLYDFFRNAAENEIEISGYSNLFFTPMYVEHLVSLIIENHKILDSGIYHAVGNDRISKYEFGIQVFKSLGADKSLITPLELTASDNLSNRSFDLSLSNTKLRSKGISFPSYKLGLESLSNSRISEG